MIASAYGLALLGATAVWHLGIEAGELDSLSGSVAAFLVDGTAAASTTNPAERRP